MAVSSAELKVVLSAVDGMTPELKKAQSALADLDKSAASSGKTLAGVGEGISKFTTVAAVAGVGALAVGLGATVKSAADFEKGISAISAVSMKAGESSEDAAKRLESLRTTALQLGQDTAYSATEAASGMEELVKAGVKVEDVIGGGARAALDLAAAGAVGVAEAAGLMSNALNTFGLDGTQAAHVADVIAGAANASAIDVSEFGFSMQAASSVAATMGVSFEDTATAIALFGQAGIKGSDAGTSLKTMLLGLIPTTEKDIALFNQLGLSQFNSAKATELLAKAGVQASTDTAQLSNQVFRLLTGTKEGEKVTKAQTEAYVQAAKSAGVLTNEFFDQTGKLKPLRDIFELLKTSTADLTAEQRTEALMTIFGTDAIRGSALAAHLGAGEFDKMAEAIAGIDAQKVANERLNNLAGSLEKMKGSIETASVLIGTAFLPVLRMLTDQFTQLVNDNMPAMEQGAKDMAAQFAIVVPQVAAFFTILVDNRETIGIVVAALATLAVLVTVTGWINATVLAFTGLWTTISLAGGLVTGLVALFGGPLVLAIAGVAAALGLLVLAWTQNWGDIQGITQTAIDTVSGAIAAGLAAIQGFWDAHGTAILALVQRAWDAIQAAVDVELKILQAAITFVMALIRGDWETAWEALKTIIQTAWDGFNAIIATVGNLMVEGAKLIVQGIIDAFKPDGPLATASANLIAWLNSASDEMVKVANTMGPGIVQGIADSLIRVGPNPFQQALFGLLQQAIKDVIGGIGGMLPRSTGGMSTLSMGGGGGGSKSAKQAQVGSIVQQMGGSVLDAQVLMAITETEGGLGGAVGDSGGSFGPFQFNINGQLQGYAKWLGVSLDEAKTAANDVTLATQYAFSTYLGQTLAQGKSLGLTGADLATYVQRYGQVSSVPELSGANFNSMFGNGGSTAGLTNQYRQDQGLPQFAQGGIVPGDIGQAIMAVIHGGEQVLTPEQIQKVNEALASVNMTLGDLTGTTGTATAAVGKMGSAMGTLIPQSEKVTAAQLAINETIGKGFPQSAAVGTAELQAFGRGAQIATDQLLNHEIGIDDAALALIRYAASTGLSIQPMQQMEAGLIGQDQALAMVLADATMVNPAYAAIAAGLITGATSATTATLDFLQLASSTQGMTDAVVPATEAFTAFGASLPALAELINAGALKGDEFTRVLIGLSNSSGLVKSTLDLATASTSDLTAEFRRIVDELAITDPRFKGLNDTLKTGAPLTDAQRIEMVKLLGVISGTPIAIDPAITANENLGTATKTMATDANTAWQGMLAEIKTAVQSIDTTVKRLADAVIGYLNNISNTDAEINVEYKDLEKAATAAKKLKSALDDLDSKTSKNAKAEFSKGTAQGGSAINPDFYASGGMVPGSYNQGRWAIVHGGEMVLTPSQQAAMLSGMGGGGGEIHIHVNAPVYGVNDMETVVVSALDRAQRRGRV